MRIAIDFDGVLNDYVKGDYGYDIYSLKPVPGAKEWLVSLINDPSVNPITVFSCRAGVPNGPEDIRNWLLFTLGLTYNEAACLVITDIKPRADIYIDDHGFRFEGRFPSITEIAELSHTWLEDK